MLILNHIIDNTNINDIKFNNLMRLEKFGLFRDLFGDSNPHTSKKNLAKLQCDDNYIFSPKNENIFIESLTQKNIRLDVHYIDILMDIKYYNMVF